MRSIKTGNVLVCAMHAYSVCQGQWFVKLAREEPHGMRYALWSTVRPLIAACTNLSWYLGLVLCEFIYLFVRFYCGHAELYSVSYFVISSKVYFNSPQDFESLQYEWRNLWIIYMWSVPVRLRSVIWKDPFAISLQFLYSEVGFHEVSWNSMCTNFLDINSGTVRWYAHCLIF
jgi:hypothetical protein